MSRIPEELTQHPHWPRLLDEIQKLLDTHRDAVVTEAGRSDVLAVRLAEGRRQGVALVLNTLKGG